MWYVKTKVVAVEIRANCTISKSLRKYLKYIPGKHDIKKEKKKQPYWAVGTYFGKF
jgi:hypothetical protein